MICPVAPPLPPKVVLFPFSTSVPKPLLVRMTASLAEDVAPSLASPFSVSPKTAVETLAVPTEKVDAVAPVNVVVPVNSKPKPLLFVTVRAWAPMESVSSWSVLLAALSVPTLAVNWPTVMVWAAPLSAMSLP